MKVSELRAGQGKVDIEVKVKSKNEPRVMQKYGRELKVCNAVVMDDSGEMSMSLWNAEADNVNAGDVIKITNGYVSEFNGTRQLTAGKYGKLEVVKSTSGSVSDSSSAKPAEKKSKNKDADMEIGKDVADGDDEGDADDFEEKEF